MMFLKRLAATLVTLMLLIGLTACTQEVNNAYQNSSLESTSSQAVGGGENYTENSSNGSILSGNSHQNNSSRETLSGSTSSNNNQNANGFQPTVSTGETNVDTTPDDDDKNTFGSQQESADNDTSAGCNHSDGDPYQSISKTEFYANYKTACCNLDATYRSRHGLLSGSLNIPGQYAVESQNRPMNSGKYIRNTATKYLDNGNTYVVMDTNGKEVMRIHKAGGYITLEEVAAYMYAFGGNGTIPANYISKKSGKPSTSIWGDYLRVNHSYFIGDTERYPYEPELPDISGCGGSLNYYEMDIGTTGTVTPGYPEKPYILNGKINRGAARIVYARQDLNGNGVYENHEVYVFYTHNHYNDFREYLNYYGGWGEMFGNITGGGVYSSKTNANPTPYVQTDYKNFTLK